MEQDYELMLSELTKRVHHLEKEIEKLGGTAYKAPIQTYAKEEVKETEKQVEIKNATTPPMHTQNVVYSAASPAASTISAPIKSKESNKTIENKIGKNFMAIVASILIFCSLVLFAGIAFKYLTDEMKFGIMMVISIAISAVGLFKQNSLKKLSEEDSNNSKLKLKTFFTALGGCGVGATYITSLVGYFVFEIYGETILITMLALWLVVTMFLGYRVSRIFVYICNVGLIVSSILITINFDSFILGFSLYTVALAALYFICHSSNYNVDSLYFIQYPIMTIIFAFTCDDNTIFNIIAALLLVAIYVFQSIFYKLEEKHLGLSILAVISNVIALCVVAITDDFNNQFLLIGILVAIAAVCGIYYIRNKKTLPTLFYTVYAISMIASLALSSETDVYDYISFAPYILILGVGLVLKDKCLRIGGYVALASSYIYFIDEYYSHWYSRYIVAAVFAIITLATLIGMVKLDYTKFDKYVLTGMSILILGVLADKTDIDLAIWFILSASLAVVMNMPVYHKDPVTGETEACSRILGYIANGFMMILGLIFIRDVVYTGQLYQVILVTLVTLVLFCINIKKLYGTKLPEQMVGIYICLKFSVLLYVILDRLEAASFVVSIVGLVLALSCIVIGFVIKQKPFRLYGLVLSLICVIKLILFDLQYDSDILRPVGFFVAGVICFAISFVYSKLEKNAAKEIEDVN